MSASPLNSLCGRIVWPQNKWRGRRTQPQLEDYRSASLPCARVRQESVLTPNDIDPDEAL